MPLEELTRTIEIVDGRTVYRQVLSDRQMAGRRPTSSSPRVVVSVRPERAGFERTADRGLDMNDRGLPPGSQALAGRADGLREAVSPR